LLVSADLSTDYVRISLASQSLTTGIRYVSRPTSIQLNTLTRQSNYYISISQQNSPSLMLILASVCLQFTDEILIFVVYSSDIYYKE